VAYLCAIRGMRHPSTREVNPVQLLKCHFEGSEAIPDITRLLRRNAPRNNNLSVMGPTSI